MGKAFDAMTLDSETLPVPDPTNDLVMMLRLAESPRGQILTGRLGDTVATVRRSEINSEVWILVVSSPADELPQPPLLEGEAVDISS